jgi:hypothetical protein
MNMRFRLIIAAIFVFGIFIPSVVFAQEGQPPYPPKPGKVWVSQPGHWELKVAWRPGVPPPPVTPPPIPPRLRRFWRWEDAKWVLVSKPPVGPYEWKPSFWDPERGRWIRGAWARIDVVPEGRVWIDGFWDHNRRIWITGHWELRPAPPVLPPPVVKPGPPLPPPPPPIVKPVPPVPPPGVMPPPPGPIPLKPGYAPRPGFHWQWDPVIKKWVQRRN